MVRVGVGRLLNLVCVAELFTRFWQHRVGLCALEPHGGPSKVIIGPSQSWICGCSVALGVFISR